MSSKKALKLVVKACKLQIETTLAGENIENLTNLQKETVNANKKIIHFINTPNTEWVGNYSKIITELRLFLANTISYKRERCLDPYRYWFAYLDAIRTK